MKLAPIAGHDLDVVANEGFRRFRVVCSCGHETTRSTYTLAASAAIGHWRGVAKRLIAAGEEVPWLDAKEVKRVSPPLSHPQSKLTG